MKPLFGDIIALISLNAAFALAVTSSSSSWAFCRLSFRMVSDVCAISLSLLTFYFLSANIRHYGGESCRRENLLIKIIFKWNQKLFFEKLHGFLTVKEGVSKIIPSFFTIKEGSTSLTKPLSCPKREDVTALRCSEPLRFKVGGSSEVFAIFCGLGPPGDSLLWLTIMGL